MTGAHVGRGFTVHGTVQGVGFRYFTCRVARTIGVTGWVSNAPDGTVVGVVRGEVAAVEEFVRSVESGPASARVARVDVVDVDATEIVDRGFVVR